MALKLIADRYGAFDSSRACSGSSNPDGGGARIAHYFAFTLDVIEAMTVEAILN
jgi:hypothetical protein